VTHRSVQWTVTKCLMSSSIDTFMCLFMNSTVCWFVEGGEEAFRGIQWTVMNCLHVLVHLYEAFVVLLKALKRDLRYMEQISHTEVYNGL